MKKILIGFYLLFAIDSTAQDILSNYFVVNGFIELGQDAQIQLNIQPETLNDTYSIDVDVNYFAKIINVNVNYNYVSSGMQSTALFTEFPKEQIKLTGFYTVNLNLIVPFNPSWNKTIVLPPITVIEPTSHSCSQSGSPGVDGLCPSFNNTVCACDGVLYQNECFAYLEAELGNYVSQTCQDYLNQVSLEFSCDEYSSIYSNFLEGYTCTQVPYQGDEIVLYFPFVNGSFDILEFTTSTEQVNVFLVSMNNGSLFCYQYSVGNSLDLSEVQTGDYYLIVDRVSPGFFSIEFCTSTDVAEIIKQNIIVAPNPASDYLEISNLQNGIKTVQLIDIQGRVHKINTTAASEVKFDTSDLSGLYFVRVSYTNGVNEMVRIIVNNQ